MALNDWMKPYKNRLLGQMHLPGSHDAGTAIGHIDLWGPGATLSNSATQTLTIPKQLEIGTRFFDLRLKEHKGQIVAHHTTFGVGAYGKDSVDSVLVEVADFCKNNPSEVVIIRISHTKLSTDAHSIAKNSAGDQLCKARGNLCKLTLEQLLNSGGGLICIFDAAAEKKGKWGILNKGGKKAGEFHDVISQKDGIHSYTKYKAGGDDFGIATCGCYSGTHKLQQVITNALKGQFDHCTSHEPNKLNHLWQIYWQKTYTNPFSTTGIKVGTTKGAKFTFKDQKAHGGTHAATDYMVKLMEGHTGTVIHPELTDDKPQPRDVKVAKVKVEGKFRKQPVMTSTLPIRNRTLPNIISYDFVNEKINKYIISLNLKGTQTTEVYDD
ncbi:MAG: hypothetical protein K2W96_11620 [Gemmataceae bacterium]|nr:hypothetical protein [Gemmataceae bacterium]